MLLITLGCIAGAAFTSYKIGLKKGRVDLMKELEEQGVIEPVIYYRLHDSFSTEHDILGTDAAKGIYIIVEEHEEDEDLVMLERVNNVGIEFTEYFNRTNLVQVEYE